MIKLGERLDKTGENIDKLGERIDRVNAETGKYIDKLGEKVDRVTANVGGLNNSMELIHQYPPASSVVIFNFICGTPSNGDFSYYDFLS